MCGTVKVADFGLSEDMYSTNYFRQRKDSVDAVEAKVPIRWMPLESIEEGLYNEKSDVVRDLQFASSTYSSVYYYLQYKKESKFANYVFDIHNLASIEKCFSLHTN